MHNKISQIVASMDSVLLTVFTVFWYVMAVFVTILQSFASVVVIIAGLSTALLNGYKWYTDRKDRKEKEQQHKQIT